MRVQSLGFVVGMAKGREINVFAYRALTGATF